MLYRKLKHIAQIYQSNFNIPEERNQVKATDIVITLNGDCGELSHIANRHSEKERYIAVTDIEEEFDKNFILLTIRCGFQNIRKEATVLNLQRAVENFLIPDIPLERQKNIAELTLNLLNSLEELNEGIGKEMEGRRKLYKAYRNILLNFTDETPVELSKIADFNPEFKHFDTINDKNEIVNFISSNCIHKTYGTRKDTQKVELLSLPKKVKSVARKGDILFNALRPEETHRFFVLDEEEVIVNKILITIRVKENSGVLPKWLFYRLGTKDVAQYGRLCTYNRRALPEITVGELKSFAISIPSIEKQMAVVEIMDTLTENFSALDEMLDREYELRKQQITYYTNKVFKELDAEKHAKEL